MKTMRGYKIWQILYPIAMFYVAEGIAFFFLQMLLGNADETYMLRQTISAAVTIPMIYSYYAQDKRIEQNVYGSNPIKMNRVLARNIAIALFGIMPFAVAFNNLLAMTPLLENSGSFQSVNDTFFAGRMLYELLGSCLVIPIAEELLFRGVVYKRLKLLFATANQKTGIWNVTTGNWAAIVLSAFLFGLVHFNLVQFLYAGVLGIVLALSYEKTNCLYVPVLGHIAANTVAVVRAESGFLNFAYEPTLLGIGVTVLLFAIAVGTWKVLFEKS